MKICFLTPIFPDKKNTHLGIFVQEQAKHIVKEGHEVTVITFGNKDEKIEGVEVIRVPRNSMFSFISIIRKFITLDKKNNFDVVNGHFVGPLTGIFGLMCLILGKKFVVTGYGIGLLEHNAFKKFMLKIYLLFSRRIICISRYVGGLASNYVHKSKLSVVKCGLDPEKMKVSVNSSTFRKRLGIGSEKVLLSVANLVRRKGLDTVIRAIPAVLKKFPKLKYVIVGDGPEEKNLKNLVKELDVEDHVLFVTEDYNKNLANYYNMCDLYVMMSRTLEKEKGLEGFGIVYIEASYLGKAVIGGKSGGTGDAIDDGKSGYRLNPEDYNLLSKKIIELLSNDTKRHKLGENGKKFVRENLLWKHNAKNTINVYEKVLDN